MKTLRLVAIALVLAIAGTSLASAANYYTPRKGKPCHSGYKKRFKRIQVHRHTKRIRICVKKRKASNIIQTKKRTLLQARLDNTPTRHLDDPYEVSYDYSASAQQEEATLEGQTLSLTSTTMPTGVLALYSDGLLECTENVGGALEAANTCNVEYDELGTHKVTTIYTSDTESTAVSETVSIDPLGTTTSIHADYIPAAEPVQKGNYWRIGSMDISWDIEPSTLEATPGCVTAPMQGRLVGDCYQIEMNETNPGVYVPSTSLGACEGGHLTVDGVVLISSTLPQTESTSNLPTGPEIEAGDYFIRASRPAGGGYTASEATYPLQFELSPLPPCE